MQAFISNCTYCCYSASVKNYVVMFNKTTYFTSIALLVFLMFTDLVSVDLAVAIWFLVVFSLSVARILYNRAPRRVNTYSSVLTRSANQRNRLELIMIDLHEIQEVLESIDSITLHENQDRMVSKNFINTLPHAIAVEESACCICMDKILIDENITILLCTHKFHSDCVDRWLLVKPLCPICKTSIN